MQLLVGILFSFAVAALLAAVQTAGGLADIVSGFSFGATVDPINGNPGGVFSEFYALVGVMLFIAIGGDAWDAARHRAHVHARAADQGARTSARSSHAAEMSFASIFTSALEVAAPVILALLITDVAFGMVSRVVPQMNVFSVAFPLKIGVSLLVVAATLPFLGGWMQTRCTPRSPPRSTRF